MREPPSETPLESGQREDRLDSWKEIAAYLDRDVTTVQRWEKREGMPVYRHRHAKRGSVYAFRADLDAWARKRNLPPEPETAVDKETMPQLAAGPGKWRIVSGVLILLAAALVTFFWRRSESVWRNPIANARFQIVTDFDGVETASAISRDGRMIAFLSDREGKMDVWVTQAGSGQFSNLTRGTADELVNPSVRTLGFSPDGSLVTFWRRRAGGQIDIWAAPSLGGPPRPYLEGVAEFDWSQDGTRLAYHTPAPGDPLFISDHAGMSGKPAIFKAPDGLHSHFPVWAPDNAYLYFVQGTLPDKMDIWRIAPTGGKPERITSHASRLSHPVLLDRRTLLYLASDEDGSGPWLYGIDVERRIPHRLTSGLDRYTSLSVSGDGRRLVVTLARPKRTLWRVRLPDAGKATESVAISLSTSAAFSPRMAPNYLVYVSAIGQNESIWKLVNGTPQELWRGHDAHILGGPVVSPDGKQIAFSARQKGQTQLYRMQHDGTNARIVTAELELQGAPAWSSDGLSIATAANVRGVPQLFRIPVDGATPTAIVQEYALDPVWSPDGRFLVYSGADLGTVFTVKAATSDSRPHEIPKLSLTRGSRRLAFVRGGQALVCLRGQIQHKNLWQVDLATGAERQLTDFAPDFKVSDFDISPDGREAILERTEERSDIAVFELQSGR